MNGHTDIAPTTNAELERLRRHAAELEQQLAERTRTADRLGEDLARFYRAFDTTPIGMALVGLQGQFLRVNQAVCSMLGRSEEELRATSFRDLTHPDDRDADVGTMKRMLAGEIRTYQREKRYIHANGHTVWILLSSTLVNDDQGRPVYFFSQFDDITERKRFEAALHDSEQRLTQFMEALPVGVFVIDSSGQPFYANEVAQRLLGRGINPQAGPDQCAALYPTYIAGTTQTYPMAELPAKRALSGTPSRVDDMEAHLPDRVVPLEVTATPIYDRDGVLRYAMTVLTDVTERRRAEETLRENMAQEEVIRAQAATLEELSTPVIPISDQVLVMPLIGTLDSRRAQQVIDTLLHGIASSRARSVILDITGVAVVDTQVANTLIRTAQAAQLLGTQVVLTGIRPEVAQTLVGLGLEMHNLVTRATLQTGIAYAMR